MRLASLIAAGARGTLVRAMSVVLRYPRLSGWLVEQLRRFPWLYAKLFDVFRKDSAIHSEKPLIEPCLTPATKEVLQALRAELAKAPQSNN